MANVVGTGEDWTVDEHDLNTWCWAIESLGGRFIVPSRFGDDVSVPYYPGQIWRPKAAGSRIITLGMWVTDTPRYAAEGADFGQIASGYASNDDLVTRKARFNTNIRHIRNLFNKTGQFTLTKYWYEWDYEAFTSSVVSASALGEIAGPMNMTMMGRFGAKLTVDIKLADPYFYAPAHNPTSIPNAANYYSLSLSGSNDFVNIGDANIIPYSVDIAGGVSNFEMVNTIIDSLSGNTITTIRFKYNAASTGSVFTFYPKEYVTLVDHGPSTGKTNLVTHSGSVFWMEFANTRGLTSGEGIINRITTTAAATVIYRIPYL